MSSLHRHHAPPIPLLSPLTLPEILRVIFSFLSQHHLLSSVTQVCKTWHSVATAQIIVTASWDESMGEALQRQHFSEWFSRARVLHCTFGQYLAPTKEIGWQARNHLEACLASLGPSSTAKAMGGQGTVHRYRAGRDPTRFKCLVLEGMYDLECFGLQPFKTIAPFVTRLDIRNWEPATFPLDELLSLFTGLQSLLITSRISTEYGHQGSAMTWQEAPPSETDRWSRLPLQSLTLSGFRCEQKLLYAFLQACPDLVELKLISFCGILQGLRLYYSNLTFQQYLAMQDMLEKISQLCPKIRSLHLSEKGLWMPMELLQGTLKVWPGLEGVSLPVSLIYGPSSTIPATFTTISPQLNHVTMLELTSLGSGTHIFDQRGAVGLHRYLREAPLLKYLKAKSVPFDITQIFDKGTKNPPTSLWACRNLETLEIRLTTVMSEVDPTMVKRAQMDSRACFAYLTKACPKLKEIWLATSELRLDLEGGLCLLTELKYLEKLVIFSTSRAELDWRDLEWLSTRKERTLPSDPSTTTVTEAKVLGINVKVLRDWMGIPKWRDHSATASIATQTTPTGLNATAAEVQSRELESAPVEKRPEGLVNQGLTEQIEWARTLGGVAEIIERLTTTSSKTGEESTGEKRCWPNLQVLWLRSELPMMKRKRALEMIGCLRPDLRYQVKPAPLEKSG